MVFARRFSVGRNMLALAIGVFVDLSVSFPFSDMCLVCGLMMVRLFLYSWYRYGFVFFMTSIRLSILLVRISRAMIRLCLIVCVAVRTSSLVEVGLLISVS